MEDFPSLSRPSIKRAGTRSAPNLQGGIAMSDQNEPQVYYGNENGPEVEGHIRPAHADPEIRISSPVEGPSNQQNDDEGPEVEGHVMLY
jgi:hypothetical protein